MAGVGGAAGAGSEIKAGRHKAMNRFQTRRTELGSFAGSFQKSSAA